MHRAFAGGSWQVVDLAADGDTVSLRIRFTGAGVASPVAALTREGDYWSLDWSGAVLRLRHTRGLGYLHELLANPGVDLHALRLAVAHAPTAPTAPPVEPELTACGSDDLGPLLDDTAKQAYRRRLTELGEELSDAEACHDTERAARARWELDALTQQLAAAFGLGGRARPTGSAAERARINITRAVRAAIARISETFPDLGHHLDSAIRTGTFSGYHPGPRPTLTWRLKR
ncbi:hypothetical protein AB0G02_15935 [Actinosynnema sp. NPDC023658]|uniref:hypothetical protein n=1 Tax=Actinosynnema sp. NPDC023658 TaxID=3155465 RepID=UPI0033FE1044